MVLEYFSLSKKRNAAATSSDSTKTDKVSEPPVLSSEDEEFLERLAAESAAPSDPEHPTVILDNGKKVRSADAQIALMDGADKIPLPSSPPEKSEGGGLKEKAKSYWSHVPSITRTEEWKSMNWSPYVPSLYRHRKAKEGAGSDTATSTKEQEPASAVSDDELLREEDDLTAVLDQLNLSARNNRVFSVTKESQKLMADFTLILKDIYNGVPTAYDDLESFLTRKNKEITSLFDNLPPWLQTLVKSLPAKLSAGLAPEVLAATSEKPGHDAKMGLSTSSSSAGGKSGLTAEQKQKLAQKAKSRIPSLKSLLAQQGAVAGMLKSILNFLKMRFPAFITGTNVLMSVAVFLLLFVFWYCHKRGRETRLEKERLAAEDAATRGDGNGDRANVDTDYTSDGATDLEESVIADASTEHSVHTPALNHPHPREVPLPLETE